MPTAAEPLPAAPFAGESYVPPGGADLLRGRLMQRSLKALLDQARGSREVLAHLAALEEALGTQGAAAIEQIPPAFAQRVYTQLRVLPIPADDIAMQDLVSRVHRVVRRNAREETHQLSPFDPEATVVITEGSHTDFMNALDEAQPQRRDR